MPQPLSTIDSSARGIVIAGGSTPHSPEFAQSVLAVVNLWAQIEYEYSNLLSIIARADPVTMTEVYQSMTNANAREDALLAAARSALPLEHHALIEAVIRSCRASRKQRNSFCHDIWGFLRERHDCLLLMPAKEAARLTAAAQAATRAGAVPQLDLSQIMVWLPRDFQEAVRLARACHDYTVQLQFTIGGHSATDHRRQSLLGDPQIERLYNKILQQNAGAQPP